MRALVAMGLLLVLCTSANAANVHHARARQPAVDRPGANAGPPAAAADSRGKGAMVLFS